MEVYIRSRSPSDLGTEVAHRMIGILLATVVVLVLFPSSTRADHATRTFYREPGEGKPSTVVRVWGENCDLGGKPMQVSTVFLQWVGGGVKTQSYPIKSDYSWAGDFVIPPDAPPGRDAGLAQRCRAADMISPGPEGYPFKILEGLPAAVVRNPAEGHPGTVISLTATNCTTLLSQAFLKVNP